MDINEIAKALDEARALIEKDLLESIVAIEKKWGVTIEGIKIVRDDPISKYGTVIGPIDSLYPMGETKQVKVELGFFKPKNTPQ